MSTPPRPPSLPAGWSRQQHGGHVPADVSTRGVLLPAAGGGAAGAAHRHPTAARAPRCAALRRVDAARVGALVLVGLCRCKLPRDRKIAAGVDPFQPYRTVCSRTDSFKSQSSFTTADPLQPRKL